MNTHADEDEARAQALIASGDLESAAALLDRCARVDRTRFVPLLRTVLDRLEVRARGVRFRYVPAAQVTVGDDVGEDDERPARVADVPAFWMAATPLLVSQAKLEEEGQRETPFSFQCPITHELMVDPVDTADGQTYERAAIEQWLRHHDTSPVTNARLGSKQLNTNYGLRRAISEWAQKYSPLPPPQPRSPMAGGGAGGGASKPEPQAGAGAGAQAGAGA